MCNEGPGKELGDAREGEGRERAHFRPPGPRASIGLQDGRRLGPGEGKTRRGSARSPGRDTALLRTFTTPVGGQPCLKLLTSELQDKLVLFNFLNLWVSFVATICSLEEFSPVGTTSIVM